MGGIYTQGAPTRVSRAMEASSKEVNGRESQRTTSNFVITFCDQDNVKLHRDELADAAKDVLGLPNKDRIFFVANYTGGHGGGPPQDKGFFVQGLQLHRLIDAMLEDAISNQPTDLLHLLLMTFLRGRMIPDSLGFPCRFFHHHICERYCRKILEQRYIRNAPIFFAILPVVVVFAFCVWALWNS